MEEEKFDCIIEGTTLKDLFISDSKKSIAVIEKTANYGTTYRSVKALSKSPYISDFKINKDVYSDKKQTLGIEAFPMLLGSQDNIVTKYKEKIFGTEIQYVEIKEIYFLSKEFFRLPVSKNELYELDISKEDKFYFYKAISSGNLEIMKENFSNKAHPLYKALVEMPIFEEHDFKRYCKGFGNAPFVYPVHGLSEISESFCMFNALRNVTFILNNTFSEDCDEKNDCKYKFTCDLGIIKADEIKRQDLKEKKRYLRVILTQKQRFAGNFLGFIQDKKSKLGFIKVIGINSIANVCQGEHQLLYFIKEDKEVVDEEIECLLINPKNILLDISFKTRYDIDQFKNDISF